LNEQKNHQYIFFLKLSQEKAQTVFKDKAAKDRIKEMEKSVMFIFCCC